MRMSSLFVAGCLILMATSPSRAEQPPVGNATEPSPSPRYAFATNATPVEMIRSCRTMIPADVELKGRIILRNRKGVVKAEHAYTLARRGGATSLALDGGAAKPVKGDEGNLLATDVTASDLTLDYLWWDTFEFDRVKESETVNGQLCKVLLLKKGDRTVRVWIDRRTGALMQAEELKGEKAVRRMWGTRLKKFGDRWMVNVMEVETVGSGHRTKVTVEELK